jgi:hypothetical protein
MLLHLADDVNPSRTADGMLRSNSTANLVSGVAARQKTSAAEAAANYNSLRKINSLESNN